MDFDVLLECAKDGNSEAMMEIIEVYKPLLIKNALVNGRFDEDLYQELISTLIVCVRRFQVLD